MKTFKSLLWGALMMWLMSVATLLIPAEDTWRTSLARFFPLAGLGFAGYWLVQGVFNMQVATFEELRKVKEALSQWEKQNV